MGSHHLQERVAAATSHDDELVNLVAEAVRNEKGITGPQLIETVQMYARDGTSREAITAAIKTARELHRIDIIYSQQGAKYYEMQ